MSETTPLTQEHLYLTEQAKLYKQFFEECGQSFVDEQGQPNSDILLPPRALHFDHDPDRTVFVAVHANPHKRLGTSNVGRDDFNIYGQRLTYRPDDFVVVTCDGQNITHWQTQSAQYMHNGTLNGIDKVYDPNKVSVNLLVTDESQPDNSAHKLRFDLVAQTGTMQLGDDTLGWILPEPASANCRERVLHPEMSDVPHSEDTAAHAVGAFAVARV